MFTECNTFSTWDTLCTMASMFKVIAAARVLVSRKRGGGKDLCVGWQPARLQSWARIPWTSARSASRRAPIMCTLTQLCQHLYIYIYIAVDLSHLNRGLTLKPCAGCGVAAIAQVWSARASRVSEVTAGLPATHLAAGRSQRSLQGQPAQYSEGSALCSYHFHRIRVYSWCPDSTCRNGVG